MAALTGNAINTSYLGLIKTTDNAAIGAVAKAITDGGGNAINLEIGTGDINFTGGNVNFTGSIVSGLDGLAPAGGTAGQVLEKIDGVDYNYAWATPSGGGGLVNGTGADSLKNADSLVTTPAVAGQPGSVVLGDGASASGGAVGRSIVIGQGAQSQNDYNTVIGPIGTNTASGRSRSTAIGMSCSVNASQALAIGYSANTLGTHGIGLMYNTAFSEAFNAGWLSVANSYGCAIGNNAYANEESVAIGRNARHSGPTTRHIAIGYYASTSATDAVAIGRQADAQASGAIALGNVVAANADYTTTKNLELTNYAALNFVDDAAAAAGGVPLGGVYHNSGALRIRLV